MANSFTSFNKLQTLYHVSHLQHVSRFFFKFHEGSWVDYLNSEYYKYPAMRLITVSTRFAYLLCAEQTHRFSALYSETVFYKIQFAFNVRKSTKSLRVLVTYLSLKKNFLLKRDKQVLMVPFILHWKLIQSSHIIIRFDMWYIFQTPSKIKSYSKVDIFCSVHAQHMHVHMRWMISCWHSSF